MLLGACSPAPSLWGRYSTPTAQLQSLTLPPPTKIPETPLAMVPVRITNSATASLPPPPSSTPIPSPSPDAPLDSPTPEAEATSGEPAILYYAQSGDTLPALAARFSVPASDIRSDSAVPDRGLITPGTLLIIPDRISEPTSPEDQLIPDTELVFSATAADFNIGQYITDAGGKLSTYREYLGSTGWTTGTQAIRRLAYENSINPMLLLAILEYESRWVQGDSVDQMHNDYPMGYLNPYYKNLFGQMLWAVNQLSTGYYGWRTGTITELTFQDGTHVRLNPRLNAGTVALQFLFAQLHAQSRWAQIVDPTNGFMAVYTQMFGDPWVRADTIDSIFPPGITQPTLALPFEFNTEWSLTGGPHGAWEHDGSLAAIDFAPATDHGGCDVTPTWVTAAAPGVIVRSEKGVVVEDLDGDGYEQTGWDLVYLHIATDGRVAAGTYVQENDRIGHASCEGGQATGTHLHFVRKYNGEWVAADGPLPMVLDGWTVHQGTAPYEGTITKDQSTIVADPVGQLKSVIIRTRNDR
jgi:LasA protease